MIALFVLGLTVGAVGYAGTELIAQETEAQTFDQQAEFAAQEAENIQNLHERNRLVTESIATSDVVVSDAANGSSEQITTYLEGERDRHDGAENIHIVDVDDGVVVSSTDPALVDTELADVHTGWAELDAEATVDDSGFVVGETQFLGEYTDPNGEYVVGYAAPIPDGEDGVSDRVAVYAVGLEPFGEELIENDGQISYLVNPANNRILMDPTGESLWHTYRDGSALIEESSSHSIGTPGDNLAGSIAAANEGEGYETEAYIASYGELPGDTGWYVVHHTPEDDALGFVHTVQQYGLYASAAGILGVVLLGGIVGRNTSKSINRLRRKAERMGEGDLEVEFESKRVDSIGQLYDEFGAMRDSLQDQIRTVELAREEAEQAREETERVNHELERKADEYREVMQACAEGDFTTRMDPETDNESMREIATEFNAMIGDIERTTAQLTRFANDVAVASEQVTASSESVRSASIQVTDSIQEISDGAERQNDSLQAVNQEMNGLSTTIEQIASASNEVADVAERTAQAGTRGREAAQAAIDGMSEIEAESDAAVEEIEQLQREVEQIDELLEFISEIAEQTNMLALNANIEASRSTESNDGFATVAAEVKELAEETKSAADDIEGRLERIETQTEQAASEVRLTSDRVAEHTTSVERAATALDEIAEYAGETNDGVQEISAASQQQAASTQEVVSMIDEAATISEETTVEAENVAAAAEEQTSALVEVTDSVNDLSDQATQLSEALDRFDTDIDIASGQTDILDAVETQAGTDHPELDEPTGTVTTPNADSDSGTELEWVEPPDFADELTDTSDEPDETAETDAGRDHPPATDDPAATEDEP
ncbi:methyl-accepting chemotaxis protein [Salinadaptatus halalkaliphilus]|nr:methyl-accepting chemotaxis protein [Salinadaptatus halalkaliphilus]